ncbi:hypothetical protein QE152_g19715 [Popillia japonica]|uniref:Uncharacterized protein n=1 Tax=Popillia japonica TaxID=7064 RepID=A0AAW1KQD4_POPJA
MKCQKSPSIPHLLKKLFKVKVQVWLGNPLNPEDWGWEIINNSLDSFVHRCVLTVQANLALMYQIQHSPVCTNCSGQSCSNVSNTADEDSYDIDEETREYLLLEESIEIQEEEEGSDEDIIVEVALEDYQSD